MQYCNKVWKLEVCSEVAVWTVRFEDHFQIGWVRLRDPTAFDFKPCELSSFPCQLKFPILVSLIVLIGNDQHLQCALCRDTVCKLDLSEG